MQGIYTYIPETNHVPRKHRVAAILVLLFIVLISLVPALDAHIASFCFLTVIITIIIPGISFMQDIYTYIPETNHVPREHCVATILM
jgi:hypothetical protein